MESTHSHPIYLISILTSSSHLHLGIPSGLFPLGFQRKILYALPICLMHAKCPTCPILLELFNLTICTNYKALHYATFSIPPYIFLGILFLNILSLCSSLSVSSLVSYPYKTTVLHILICTFLHRRHENRRLN